MTSRYMSKIQIRHRNSPEEWIEVNQLDFGSLDKPNEDILEVRITMLLVEPSGGFFQ